MIKVASIVIIILSLGCLCYGYSIEGGQDVVVIGSNKTTNTGGSSDTVDLSLHGGSIINTFRDPTQYDVPTIKINKTNPTNNTTSATYLVSTNAPMTWRMESSVKGTGNFSEWNMISNQKDLKSKQSSSAISGELNKNSREAYIVDQSESSTTKIMGGVISQSDSLTFVGDRYSEDAFYLNKGDLIRNTYRAGAIAKDRSFIGYFIEQNISDNEVKNLLNNRSTTYSVNTRFVGESNLKYLSNETEISQDYIGSIALNMRLRNVTSESYDINNTGWLPCCTEIFV
jgi:hypothetical protein